MADDEEEDGSKSEDEEEQVKEEGEASEEPEEKEEQKEASEDERIDAILARERVITEDSDEARNLYQQSGYGQLLDNNKVQLSLLEGLYLLEREKIRVEDGDGNEIGYDDFMKRAQEVEPKFWVRYSVFKDIRKRGYIIKTALKFGADFRVYDRGIKPGEDHARWVVYPVHEGETLTWHEFAAKNRVAHSTKKRLLIGVVDDENDVSYWEVKWMRP